MELGAQLQGLEDQEQRVGKTGMKVKPDAQVSPQAVAAAEGVCSFEAKWMSLDREIQLVDREHKAFVSEFLEVAQVQRRKARSLLLDGIDDSAVSALREQLQHEAMAFSSTYADTIDAAEDYLSFFLVSALDRFGKYLHENSRVLDKLASTLKATRIKLGILQGGDFDRIRERRKSARSMAWRLLRELHRRSPAAVDLWLRGALKTMIELEGCIAVRRMEIAGLRQKLKNIDEMLARARELVDSGAVERKRAVPTDVEVKIGKERVQKREEIVRSRSKSKILPEETIPNLNSRNSGKTEQPREQNLVRRRLKYLEKRKEVQQQRRFKQAARELRKLCETLTKKRAKTMKPMKPLPTIEEEDLYEEKKKNRFLGKIKLSTFSCFSGG